MEMTPSQCSHVPGSPVPSPTALPASYQLLGLSFSLPPPHPGLIADYDRVSSWSHRLNLVEVIKYSHFSGHAVLSVEPSNDKLEPIADIWCTIW